MTTSIRFMYRTRLTPPQHHASETPPGQLPPTPGQPPPQRLTDLLRSNPALQADLDDLITARISRGRKPGDVDPAALQAELDKLKAAEAERERQRQIDAGNFDRARQSLVDEHTVKMTAAEKEKADLLADIRTDRCHNRLVVEATRAGAIDPDAIADMLDRHVTLDDRRRVVVLGADGQAMFKGGTALTVADLIERHKQEKPWAYKAEAVGEGSPARGGQQDGGDPARPAVGNAAIQKQIDDLEAEIIDLRATAANTGQDADVTKVLQAKAKLRELKEQLKPKK